jgi:hypothetical protein
MESNFIAKFVALWIILFSPSELGVERLRRNLTESP